MVRAADCRFATAFSGRGCLFTHDVRGRFAPVADSCSFIGRPTGRVAGRFHGPGLAVFRNGCTYKGMFDRGLMHGKGTFSWRRSGVKYVTGQWSSVPVGTPGEAVTAAAVWSVPSASSDAHHPCLHTTRRPVVPPTDTSVNSPTTLSRAPVRCRGRMAASTRASCCVDCDTAKESLFRDRPRCPMRVPGTMEKGTAVASCTTTAPAVTRAIGRKTNAVAPEP